MTRVRFLGLAFALVAVALLRRAARLAGEVVVLRRVLAERLEVVLVALARLLEERPAPLREAAAPLREEVREAEAWLVPLRLEAADDRDLLAEARSNALTSWSLRIACHPGTPCSFAICPRTLRV